MIKAWLTRDYIGFLQLHKTKPCKDHGLWLSKHFIYIVHPPSFDIQRGDCIQVQLVKKIVMPEEDSESLMLKIEKDIDGLYTVYENSTWGHSTVSVDPRKLTKGIKNHFYTLEKL